MQDVNALQINRYFMKRSEELSELVDDLERYSMVLRDPAPIQSSELFDLSVSLKERLDLDRALLLQMKISFLSMRYLNPIALPDHLARQIG